MPFLRDRWAEVLPAPFASGAERALFLLVALSVALALVSIAASQVLFFSALAVAAALRLRGDRRLRLRPAVALPLGLFFAWTVAAALLGPAPLTDLAIVKKFGLFLILWLAPAVLRGRGRIEWTFRAIFAVSGISSLFGIGQFVADPGRDLLNRIHGFMGQWMTYSGLQMLVLVLLAAYALTLGIRRWWIPLLAVLLGTSLILSYTRNAWLGALTGVVAILAIGRPRAILATLAGIVFLTAVSPDRLRARIQAAWDPEDATTRGRLELASTAIRLIRDNPWFGVGPKSVGAEALRYRGSREFPDWLYQHMHNNILQIAAERGLPGLALWLWLMGRLAWDALRLLRGPAGPDAPEAAERRLAAAAALGAWSALAASGMFEYNFGDSEVLLLFLFLMSVPYACAEHTVDDDAPR